MTPPDDAENAAGKQRGRPFQPGQSGNPSGKAKGTRNIALQALDAIGEEHAEELVRQAVALAMAGDAATMRVLLERVWPARRGRAVTVEIPEMKTAGDIVTALGTIASATAAGEISVEEAQALAGVIEVQRRALETQKLEERIAALEARGGTGR